MNSVALTVILTLQSCLLFVRLGAQSSSQPNIVFVLADDYGYHDIGYHGSRIRTPVLDQLASEGVKLENYYVQPICTPTRSQLMSGRYQVQLKLSQEMEVPYVELKDKYGNSINFGNFGDILVPALPMIEDFRQHKADIREMNLKPNDVFLTGYPKSGTHWHHEIVHMLINGSAQYSKVEEGADFIELNPIKKGDNPPDSQPRVFFTHLKLHHLPKQVWEKKVKVIYLQRNPKDTWVSLYNHAHGHKGCVGYDGTWGQFFDLLISFGFWYGNWFDYVLDWERVLETQTEVDIFCSAFEDLKKDPVGQIAKLDQFLGYNRGRELYEQIADACSFTRMQSAKNEIPEEIKKRYFKDDYVGFYRKGEVGDWKNWFTVAQNERFDEVYKKRMAGSKLRYTFEL